MAVLEERIAALEGGVGAVGTASGQAALHLAIATLMGAGGHIVASTRIYGGTHNMFTHTLPRFGITTSFVDPRDPAGFSAAITGRRGWSSPRRSAIPVWRCWTSAAVADVAHEARPAAADRLHLRHALPVPPLRAWRRHRHALRHQVAGRARHRHRRHRRRRRPLRLGGSGKFPTMTEPYAGYHGIAFAEEFGPAAFIMRARAEGLRDFGACMSPANAFYLLQGIETLPVRMARHVANCETRRALSWRSTPPSPG